MPRWELACLSRRFTCWNWQLAGTLAGFLGACLRLTGTTDLGARYLTATADQQPALLTSYLDLQRLVNTSFSAGGLVALGGLCPSPARDILLIISFGIIAGRPWRGGLL